MKTRIVKLLFTLMLMLALCGAFTSVVSAQEATPGAEVAATVEVEITSEPVGVESTGEPVEVVTTPEVTPENAGSEVTVEPELTPEPTAGEPEATLETTPDSEESSTQNLVEIQGVDPGTVSVRAIDTNGDKVIGTVCITEFLDAGGGTPGTQVGSICGTPLGNPIGLFFGPNRAPDDYVISVTTTPGGYTAPANAVYSVTSNNETIVNLVFQITGTIQAGSIQVTKVDAADTSIILPGACFSVYVSVNGNFGTLLASTVCDDDDGTNDGVTLIENIQAGAVLLLETVVPDEYEPGDAVEVTVVTDQQTDVEIGNTFVGAKGSFLLTAEDENGDPVEGACFEIYKSAGGTALGDFLTGGVDLCSNASGVVLNSNSNPGDIVIVNVVTPVGFGTPVDQVFTIVSNLETDIAIVFPEVDENTPGSIRIFKQDNSQETLAGACFQVFEDDGGERGASLSDEVCDDDDGDSDGQIDIADVTPGDVLLAETVAPDDFILGSDIELTVNPGQRTTLVVKNKQRPEQSFFVLTAEDENGDPVEGACFEVYEDAGNGALGALITGGTGLCSDENGHVLDRDQDVGDYIVINVVTPDGFGTPADQPFTVGEREEVPVVVVLPTVDEDTPGRIRIFKTDTFQNVLTGACFQVFEDDDGDRGTELSDEICDDDDGFEDGRINIDDIPPGDVLIAETVAPDEFKIGPDTETTINPGQRSDVIVANQPLPESSSFLLTTEDENGDPVEGACFEVYEDAGNGALGDLIVGGTDLCSNENGFVLQRSQAVGDYVVVTVVVPDGFGTPEDQPFTVIARDEALVVVELPAVDENAPGRIRIFKFDNLQNALTGACFQIFADDDGDRGAELSDEVCDPEDGANDGRINIDDIPPGSVLIAETEAPDEFKIGPDVAATVKPGQRTDVTIANQPRPDRSSFILTAEDGEGDPVEGACFEVYVDEGGGDLGELIVGGTDLCSNSSGFALSRFQDPGSYVVVVVTTPDGFVKPANVRFVVGEREEVPVPVVFVKIAPDDDENGNEDEDDEKETVTKLPNTGAGQPNPSLPLLPVGIFILLSAAGAMRLRRVLG